MPTRRRITVLALGCLTALAACGSSGSQTATKTASSATSTPSAATATATGSSTAAAAVTEASKPPNEILSDMAAALRDAHGYAMQGTITQDRQRLRLKLTTTSATSVDLAFAIGDATAELIGVPGASYIRGNTAFWRSQAAPRLARLANHWIEVPSSNARSLTSSLGSLAPATLAHCLIEDHGTLTLVGRTTIDGQPAILLKDAGDLPGSSPSVVAVAATGAPYPLRYTATGGQRAGGRVDVCNDGKASDARGTITFSQFGKVPPIQPPKGAVQLTAGPRA
jgi:hypothetical protein